ncbi:MAG: glycosyltransferase [Planctomycetes bacterium]|nr:glycosyltransferase [Planctomycetota bacterium]
MRILHVIHGFLPQFRGGTELYLLGLARAQRELGHEVEIVAGTTHDAPEAQLERYEFDGFPVTKIVLAGSYLEHWTRSFSPEATRLFAECLRRLRPDLVHVQHWYRLSRSLIETCHRLGVPAVCTLHDLWTTCPRIFRIRDESFCERPLGPESCAGCVPRFPFMDEAAAAEEVALFRDDFRNEMRLARRIIVPSGAHGDVVAASAEIPRDRLIVLPHGSIIGVDGTESPAAPRRRQDPGRRRLGRRPAIRLGIWGHLFHMKGVHLVLEALRQLGRRNRRFELHVWGEVIEPRYKARLEELAEDLDVAWHGAFQPADIAGVELDCALIPSLCSESFSFVLDEAFALGLPAIVSDRGALAERIGAAGATFRAEDPTSLARVLERLADEPGRLAIWRRAIPELKPMARHAGRLLALYQAVLDEEQPDARSDPGLPWRRLEHQTRMTRRYEAVMFGQIGHIKREAGRGDHYEGEMRKLMREKDAWVEERGRLETRLREVEERDGHERAIIASLAIEIENFRRALDAYLSGRPMPALAPAPAPDLPEHVPGLGPVSVLVAEDAGVLGEFARVLPERRAERERLAAAEVEYEAKVARLERELGRIRAGYAELETAFGREHDSHRAAVEVLSGLETELEKERELRGRLEATLASARAEHRSAVADLAEVETEIDHLRGHAERASDLERELEQVREACENCEESQAAEGRRIEALEAEIAALRPRSRRGEELAAKLEELRRQQAEASAALERSRRRQTEMEVELAELRPRSARTDEVTARAEELADRLARRDRLIELLAALIEDLRRGIVAVWDPAVTSRPRALPAEVPEEHAPGLGDIATIAEVNARMIRDLHDEVLRLRGASSPPAAEED